MRFTKRLIGPALALLVMLPGATLAAGLMKATPDLDATIAKQMEEAAIAGLGAAILVDGRIVWAKGYGYADVAKRAPFTPDTIMNIGSITKTVTGVALMRLVQEGKLSLDADVNTYLPFKLVNPHQPGAVITLRQLATHTSGITDRWDVYKDTYHYGGEPEQTLGDFLKAYFLPGGKHYSEENFLDKRPGTHRDYSNIGAALAGYIVELKSGEPLSDYTRRNIFLPLGMSNTGWTLAGIDRSRHSQLYVSQNGMTIPIPLYGLTTYPDGALRTSVADLSRLFAALLNDGAYEGARILDEGTAREMRRFEYTEANKPDNVKLDEKNTGIFWQSKYNVTRMGHGGSDPGISTEMLASLSRDIGVVLFVNTSTSGEEARANAAIFAALWKQAEEMKATK
ncbi:serine hydrolase domain-containing protein [Arenimonas sp.]|uniref:serine hydrolase domain-containing protein n=1 Tax=Arenimonas sp. TaxID=1872635 RepID=UPI0039E3F552